MKTYSIIPLFLLSMPGGSEWIWIILAVLILFGGRKIPELARGLGKGMKEFKDAKEGVEPREEAPSVTPAKQIQEEKI